jgi:ankyrin repeat protein
MWPPARELDTTEAQHREWTMPPAATCTCPCPAQPRQQTSILHLSVASGNCEILKMLLQADDIDIDLEDSQGYTPLQRAVMAGRADIVAILLEYGADINNGRD